MAEWYRCRGCDIDLRVCRHHVLCKFSALEQKGETERVRSVIATYVGLNPQKGFKVIEGGGAHKEAEGQVVDS